MNKFLGLVLQKVHFAPQVRLILDAFNFMCYTSPLLYQYRVYIYRIIFVFFIYMEDTYLLNKYEQYERYVK